jgi:tRNA 2-thiouridine synthesizing protein E
MTNSDAIRVAHDVEGCLINPQDRNKPIACAVAAEQGIAAEVRHSIACLVEKQQWDREYATQRGIELFPCAYLKQACKIAGMMRPRAWSNS